MTRDTEGGTGRGGYVGEMLRWLNGLHDRQVPPHIRRHQGSDGRVGMEEFRAMPEHLRVRIERAYKNSSDGGDPFPNYDPPKPVDTGAGDGAQAGTHPPAGGGNPGGGGGPHHAGGPGGGPGPGGNDRHAPHAQNNKRQEAIAEYGFSMAFLNHHPELKRLFNQAVAQGWSVPRFVAELRDTKWFQKNSATARQFMVNRLTDPASWQADLDRTTAHVRDTWGQLFGVPLDHDLARKVAFRAMRLGWTDEQINDHLVASMNFRKLLHNDTMGGTAAQTANQMRQMAADYGVDPSNHWYAAQMKRVLGGNDTMDGTLNALKERAKNKYEAFADQLDAGKTMREIADPYTQQMAQLLELNPNQVGLQSRLINKALTRRVDGKTQPMSLGDFEDAVRTDPRWMHTQQAKDQFSQTAYGLLSNWGLI